MSLLATVSTEYKVGVEVEVKESDATEDDEFTKNLSSFSLSVPSVCSVALARS